MNSSYFIDNANEIVEWIVSMLKHSGLSDGFWAEALLTTVHIINMSPSRPLGYRIPQKLWFRKSPDYRKLQILWMCPRMTIETRATVTKMHLFRIWTWRKLWIPWDLENRRVVHSAYVVFNESKMHTVAERHIELRRVTLVDATPPLDSHVVHKSSVTVCCLFSL